LTPTVKTPADSTVAKKLILLVDDHPIFRHGLEAFLKKHHQELTCVHADSQLAALQSIRDFPVDAAVVDVSLAGADGIQLMTQMKTELPHLAIIVLTMHDDPANVVRAFRAGAQAYVIKTDPPRELLQAMDAIAKGEIFLSSRLRRNPAFKVLYDCESMLGQLTHREAEVLAMIGKGHSTASIAKELGLSVKTVETHQAHIKEKLDFATGKEMTEFAINLVSYRGTSSSLENPAVGRETGALVRMPETPDRSA
jgi:DNA-binding NarL/FixJ family response regulator